jgi:hypothetical protein
MLTRIRARLLQPCRYILAVDHALQRPPLHCSRAFGANPKKGLSPAVQTFSHRIQNSGVTVTLLNPSAPHKLHRLEWNPHNYLIYNVDTVPPPN